MDPETEVLVNALMDMGEEVLHRAPLVHEGKAKRMKQCPTDDRGRFIVVEFKDSLTAFDAVKKAEKAGKGRLNCAISSYLMGAVQAENSVPTTFIQQISPIHQLMWRVDIVRIEVIVRNEAHGSLCRRYGIEPGTKLACPLVEFGLKDDALHDPFFTDPRIPTEIMTLLTRREFDTIAYLASCVNYVLNKVLASHGINLLDFKLEFGRLPSGAILLADEITGDTCRLVTADTGEKLDKDIFRFDIGDCDIIKAYIGLATRLGLDPEAIIAGRWH